MIRRPSAPATPPRQPCRPLSGGHPTATSASPPSRAHARSSPPARKARAPARRGFGPVLPGDTRRRRLPAEPSPADRRATARSSLTRRSPAARRRQPRRTRPARPAAGSDREVSSARTFVPAARRLARHRAPAVPRPPPRRVPPVRALMAQRARRTTICLPRRRSPKHARQCPARARAGFARSGSTADVPTGVGRDVAAMVTRNAGISPKSNPQGRGEGPRTRRSRFGHTTFRAQGRTRVPTDLVGDVCVARAMLRCLPPKTTPCNG